MKGKILPMLGLATALSLASCDAVIIGGSVLAASNKRAEAERYRADMDYKARIDAARLRTQSDQGSTLNHDRDYLFVSDGDWSDKNLNTFFETKEFGDIRNTFESSENMMVHVVVTQKGNETYSVKISNVDNGDNRTFTLKQAGMSQRPLYNLNFGNGNNFHPGRYSLKLFRDSEEVERTSLTITP